MGRMFDNNFEKLGGKKTKAKSGKQKAKSNPAVISYTAVDPDAPENAQEFELKKRVKSQAEAKRLAEAKLRELNAKVMTGSMTLVGSVKACAGTVIEIKGFGSFDGRFVIEEARHSVGSSGYTTDIRLRRVNMDY
jgi:hypothetical protein